MIDYSDLNTLPELYSDCDENESDYEQQEEEEQQQQNAVHMIDAVVLQQNNVISTSNNTNTVFTTLRTEKDKLMLLVVKLTIKKLVKNVSLHNNLHKFLKDLIIRSRFSFQSYLRFLTLLLNSSSNTNSLSLTEFKKKILFLLILSDVNSSKRCINNWSKISGYPKEKLIGDLNHFKLINELSHVNIDKKDLTKTSTLVRKEINKFIKAL